MNKFRYEYRQGGFTLIELMIGMLLTVTLMSAVFGLLSTSTQSWIVGNSRMELQQTARHAVDLIARDLHYAKSVTIVSAESLTILTDQYVANQHIDYFLDRSGSYPILRRNQNDGSGNQPVTGESTLAISITDLQFTLSNSKTVGISLTATDITSPDPNQQRSFQIMTAVTAVNVPD